jgi:haloalkane dehalogenase
VIDPAETFDGTWPFTPRFSEAPGFRMHYVDEGGGEPLLCLHGEPTWGYLFRNFIPPLSGTHRVIVPDHMGFGKSATPRGPTYTLRTHVENLTRLIEALDLRNLTLVLHDWGGPIGVHFTLRHPERVKRICLLNTFSGYGLMGGGGNLSKLLASPWFRWIAEGYESGRTREVLLHVGSTLLSVMKLIGLENAAVADEHWIRAYSAPFPTPEESVGALEFPLDVHLDRIGDMVQEGLAGLDALKRKPAMLAEGTADRAIPPELAIADFRGLWPHGPLVTLDGVGHFSPEDAPQTLVALIQQFVQMTP